CSIRQYVPLHDALPISLGGHKGAIGCCIMSQEFYETDPSRGFVRGYSFEILRGVGPVFTAMMGMNWGRLPWGDEHHRAYAEIFRSEEHTSELQSRENLV